MRQGAAVAFQEAPEGRGSGDHDECSNGKDRKRQLRMTPPIKWPPVWHGTAFPACYHPVLYAVVQVTFRQLINDADVGAGAPWPPRLHDLRHTLAVRTLLGWYQAGEDVQAKMPSL
jgi:hypothetical protein